MKGRCKIRIEFSSEKAVLAALAALEQEQEFKKRSLSKLFAAGKTLVVEIGADDVVALRATVNSYLRALQAIESVERVSGE